MNNATIWAISLIALTLILIALFAFLVNSGKEVMDGLRPKLRPKKNGHFGEKEEFEIPNPDFNDTEAESDSNPRLIKAVEPVMKTVYPHRRTGIIAMAAIATIVISLTWALTRLNGEQDQTKQAVAEIGNTATNALQKAFEAEGKALIADGKAETLDRALKAAFGTTTVNGNDGKRYELPNLNNVLKKDDVDRLLAGVDGRITAEAALRSNQVVRIDARLNALDDKLTELGNDLGNVTNMLALLGDSVAKNGREVVALRTNQSAAIAASAEATRTIETLKGSIASDLSKALTGARTEIERAVTEAKEATKNRPLPPSVIQEMTVPRTEISLAYRRAGMFQKHNATVSYQATLNGRPDMATNIVVLLEKFEGDHKAMIVKGLEVASSKKQPTNKDKAIVALADRVRADFNAWILGEWDFRRAGPAPQITSITITDWKVSGNDEE